MSGMKIYEMGWQVECNVEWNEWGSKDDVDIFQNMALEIGFPCAWTLSGRCRWMVLLSFWRSVRRIWFVNGAIYETLSTKAVRAVWIPSFRRHPIFSSYFRENDFYPIHQFHRWSCIIQEKLDSGLWGPSRADSGGSCALPCTLGDGCS